jgi:hypothetical protein
MVYTDQTSMTSRNPHHDGESGFVDQTDWEVEELHTSVKALGQVSRAIRAELDAHNQLLEGMADRYHQSMSAVGNLLVGLKGLVDSTGLSPMTLTVLFAAALMVFLWLYWKIH